MSDLSKPLLNLIEATVRSSARNGITETHLFGAIADDQPVVAVHLASLVTEKRLIKLGETLFTPANAPKS